jgi:hypothetical protein
VTKSVIPAKRATGERRFVVPGSVAAGIVLLTLSCPACQKDQLPGSAFSVQVAPPAAAVSQGTSKTFTASLQGAGGSVDGSPGWTVSPTSLGTVSPAQGGRVVFTPGSTPAKSGALSATFNGVTGSAQIFIGGSVPASGSKTYGLFVETLPPPGVKFGVSNPPDSDGAVINTFGAIATSDGTNPGEFTEGTKSLKAVYDASSASFGGWSIQWGTSGSIVSHDFSAFAGGSLVFDARMTQDIQVKITWNSGSFFFSLLAQGIPNDNQFHSVSIPLSSFSGIDLTTLQSIAFSAVSVPSETYYIDNARFQK